MFAFAGLRDVRSSRMMKPREEKVLSDIAPPDGAARYRLAMAHKWGQKHLRAPPATFSPSFSSFQNPSRSNAGRTKLSALLPAHWCCCHRSLTWVSCTVCACSAFFL
uniref:Uncharacterized protein n=1 Tax=Sexangularia sp. CB-2014 TaxID=1486929 RepID=A0A7S1YA24_9EUKA